MEFKRTDWLTKPDIAALTGLPYCRIRYMIKTKKIPPPCIDGVVPLWGRDIIIDWFKNLKKGRKN